ncbi:MAG: plastocyanin/azurin family copper-binding protein [Nitrososphaeraceae archaeon]
MTTEDENHPSIIRTSPRRLGKGIAILVVVMAVGAAIAVPNWTNMVKYPPPVTTLETEPSPAGVSEGEGLPAAEETETPVPAGAMTITIPDGAAVQGNPDYDPDDAQVPLDSKVVWENADSVPHTATSGSGPEDANSGQIFDTSIINNGESSAPIELAGAAEGDEIAYYCQVHPYMTSSLTVTAAGAGGSTSAPATEGGGGAEAAGASLTIPEGASVQGNPSYEPDPLTITAGDTVEVSNQDTVPHTVTSGTGPEDAESGSQFDTSIIDAGATAQVDTASLAAGDYPYYCSVHPYMLGTLKVS